TFSDTDIAVYRAALRQPGALTAAINYYRANVFSLFSGGGEERRWAETRVSVPTLFIYGERDPFVIPETVRGISDFIDAPYREVRLARAGHWVQQEYPQEVNAALASFLEE
ncbi:MAG TPA: alpha/beta hydrolase, partial [Pyrinomonadaceae bacterium]